MFHRNPAPPVADSPPVDVPPFDTPADTPADTPPSAEDEEEHSYRPLPPRHAWRSPNSPVSQYNPRRMILPLDRTTEISEETSHSGNTTERSHRTSELSSEWLEIDFHPAPVIFIFDVHSLQHKYIFMYLNCNLCHIYLFIRGFSKNATAELMLKRARKMKYNALRKKKLNGGFFRL